MTLVDCRYGTSNQQPAALAVFLSGDQSNFNLPHAGIAHQYRPSAQHRRFMNLARLLH